MPLEFFKVFNSIVLNNLSLILLQCITDSINMTKKSFFKEHKIFKKKSFEY